MRATGILSEQTELRALRALSGRVGGNPLLVQASSGNTSIKVDGLMWIKASGKWLMHADDEDFLIPVKLANARRRLRENRAIAETAVQRHGAPTASIETAMHAVLPHRVVVHVHSVNTVAWAVRDDGPRQLAKRLAGLEWQWIRYTASGVSLAREIETALSYFPETNVLVLGNHGLVVCGNSCDEAERLLAEVEQRLAIEPRLAPEPKCALLQQVLAGSSWSLPKLSGVHVIATDRISRRILAGGVLYPCQAIFLPETCWGPENTGKQQAFMVIEDGGVLACDHATRAQREMLLGLANIVQRIDAAAPVRYLTPSEVTDVMNEGADSYRRSADTGCHSHISNAEVYKTAGL